MADLGARIRELSDLFGPSGREDAVRAHLRRALAGGPWDLAEDAVGNLYAFRAGSGPQRLLVLVPMDEPGLVVTRVDDRGRAAVAGLGPLRAADVAGRRVALASGAVAAVGVRPSAGDEERTPVFDRLYLDLGARSREEAQAAVAVGDQAVPDLRCAEMAGGRLCGKALGSRAACAAALEALTALAPVALPSGAVTVAFVAQTEVGHRGVRPAVRRVQADLLISVGAAAATDTPRARGSEVRLGGGPVLVVTDRGLVASPPALDALADAAARAGVALQAAAGDPGITAAGPALIAASGAPAGALGVPIRHRHTGAEVCDPADVAGLARVLGALIAGA